ncbi:MAG TPA: hypothetical protein VFC81_05685 [Verrucomicrobiae bacterium]|nr:hypothetical protein [Verrucomicrobiae bacterium]
MSGFDPGALLARHYELLRGPRVCLRLARVRDQAGIEELLHRQGMTVTGLELARLLRSHPRERIVICATALIGSADTIVGVGSLEIRGSTGAHAPTWVVADQAQTDGLEELLHEALIGRARALTLTQAA